MTPEALAAIQACAEAATPGPWYRGSESGVVFSNEIVVGEWDDDDEQRPIAEVEDEDDARFIVWAREDIPALLEALRESEAENARLRAEVQSRSGPCHCDPSGSGEEYCHDTCTLQANNTRLRAALETITRELDQTIVWRRTSGMRPATDISMFASTALSACLRLQRTLAALAEPSAEGGQA